MKFKIGDRVKVVKSNYCTGEDKGLIGTVVWLGWDYIVEFDKAYYFTHSCGGVCPNLNGRFYDDDELELVSYEWKIIITTNGRETLARLYENDKVIKSATAKCSPEDTFDFKVGADLAFRRLMTEEPPKYFMGKAVCIEDGNNPTITKGKIYDFSENDGCGKNDVGGKIINYPCTSLDDINEMFRKIRFLEIKE